MSDKASEENLNLVATNLNNVENIIGKFTDRLDLDDLDSQLELKESAKLNVGVAFALGSLYYILLKCKGAGDVQGTGTDINGELDRIKEYVQKISNIEKVPEIKKLTLDSDAAARIVKHNLDLNDTKRRKLNS
jgi:hypothetical protein